ncbi:hypothetical protein B5M42_000130 [Paenibacillus athensensis]|uniref:Uncharacterized protein n=1 Tax=Paenibacillus athensensis TaxID=1967502 RepID=A0A4Y8PRZ7_9BACL|nr:hypothetical protein [Paenibacillus athensensis]MCD1257241.1 hypothetical protein [Paenibacillus athensensis]
MAGRKTFHNQTNHNLSLTLYIREGENPSNSAGTQDMALSPYESKVVEYGNSRNIYLNGFVLVALLNGEIMSRQEFVVTRGSQLDDKLNRNSIIDIMFQDGFFNINGHN